MSHLKNMCVAICILFALSLTPLEADSPSPQDFAFTFDTHVGDYEAEFPKLIVMGVGIEYSVRSGVLATCDVNRIDGQQWIGFNGDIVPVDISFKTFETAPATDIDNFFRSVAPIRATRTITPFATWRPRGSLGELATLSDGTAHTPNGDQILAVDDGIMVDIRKAGDATGDDNVDFADFLIVQANFGLSDVGYNGGDFDLDGTVGFEDFLILSQNFGS